MLTTQSQPRVIFLPFQVNLNLKVESIQSDVVVEEELGDDVEVEGATGLAVGEIVGDATGLAVGDATGDATGLAVGEAIGDATGLAVGEAIGDSVGDDVVVPSSTQSDGKEKLEESSTEVLEVLPA